jgi:MHS family proline/betaine transporter-like MFS transporter
VDREAQAMTGGSAAQPVRSGRVLAAGFVGNILEWYDFAVYGFFAPTIGKLFFPSDDSATSLIASFGAFAAGFLMRPVGAVLFGYVGDLLGRKRALMLSVVMMAIPTFLVGLLPTHAQIGLAAAALMVLLRMVQGVSVGGEYTSSFVFLVEHAPDNRRAFFGSWSLIGATGGILLGSAVGALIANLTTDAQQEAWAWRLPFLAGVLIAGVGLAIRRGIPEQPVAARPAGSPLVEAVTGSWRRLLQAVGLNSMGAVVFYTVFIYMATWLVQEVGETRAEALDINTISMLALALVVVAVALLSDRIGRKPFLLFGSAGIALFGYPLVWLMHHHDPALILAGQIGLAILLGTFSGVIPATMAELFPRNVRVSAASVSYNLPYAMFGGTAPLVATWLVTRTGDAMAISWYLVGISAFAFLVTLTIPETRRVRLGE